MSARISRLMEGGGAAAQPTTRNPAQRNSSPARGKCTRSLTKSTVRKPLECNRRAVSQAFSNVFRDRVSTISASPGTPRASAARRMNSASGSGPQPPPENIKSGAAPSLNILTPQSIRRSNMAGPEAPRWAEQPRTTMASAACAKSYALAAAASAPAIRAANAAARKRSRSPSRTAPVFEVSTPVRRSLTIWYGCRT
jgi:hypothetical protein